MLRLIHDVASVDSRPLEHLALLFDKVGRLIRDFSCLHIFDFLRRGLGFLPVRKLWFLIKGTPQLFIVVLNSEPLVLDSVDFVEDKLIYVPIIDDNLNRVCAFGHILFQKLDGNDPWR